MKRSMLSMTMVGSCLIASLTGCEGVPGGGGPTDTDPQQIQRDVTLTPFPNCDGLEAYIEDNRVKEMAAEIDRLKQYYYSPGGNSSDLGFTSGGPGTGNPSSGPSAFTTTNTQVKGVDEPDIIKNDGTRIFSFSGNMLRSAQSWPPASLGEKGKLAIEGAPISMFLEDARVTVLSNVWLPKEPGVNPANCYYCTYGSSATKVTVVDVSDLANLKVIGEKYFPGYLSDARRIGGSVRLVIRDYLDQPPGVIYWPDYSQYNDEPTYLALMDALKKENEKIIRAQTLTQWLKQYEHKKADGTIVDLGYSCTDFVQMNAPTKVSGMLNVVTVNLDELAKPGHRVSVLGEIGTVYASQTSLYIAEWHWWWGAWATGQEDAAYIHKFDITDPNKAVYKASGPIAGHINDQFSLDEHNGNMRVAHTVQTFFNEPNNAWGRWERTNRVTVLGENAGKLEVIGTTPDVAPGEMIQSARFVGDKAYVVTFRQVDPLFTIDLADPANPKVIGQLKIPGFSSYLHPLDENHLLTIGVLLPEDGSTWSGERRVQLSIFDVTDFANPVQKFNITSGTMYAHSPAQGDHKAFNYFPERGLLALPFTDYLQSSCVGTDTTCWDSYWSTFVSDVRVFKIDTATGITPVGAVSMTDVYKTYNYDGWSNWVSPWVQRSVMATDAQGVDFVYAISDAGIRVANLATMETIGTALFSDP